MVRINKNTFRSDLKIENNTFSGHMYLSECQFEGGLKFDINTFKSDFTLVRGIFYQKIIFSFNTFNSAVFLKSLNIAQEMYLLTNNYSQGIIVSDISFINPNTSDSNKIISNKNYLNQLIKKEQEIDTCNSNELSEENEAIKQWEETLKKEGIIKEKSITELLELRQNLGFLKHTLIKQDNNIDASCWYYLETGVQQHIFNKKLFMKDTIWNVIKNWGDWLVFSLSGVISNHKQNIFRPFVVLFTLISVTACIMSIFNNNNDTFIENITNNLVWADALRFIIPTNLYIDKEKGFLFLLLQLAARSFFAYIIWHIIQTSRLKLK